MPETFYPGIVQPESGKPSWKCTTCNFVFRGEKPPRVCPLCHHESEFEIVRDYRDFSFIEVD